MNLIGLYIHIPFCKQKCKYCDFISFENCEDKIINQYINALIEEIKFRANSLKTIDNQFLVKTIYIGGGTPSIINDKHIYNILDTIYDVEDTLDKILKLDLTHISVYSLILEENTELAKLVNSNKLKLPDEEIERYMYWYAKRRLEDNGFIHYEISNFALPSYRCQHNIDCWNQKEYIGIGLNAASYMSNLRFKNISDLRQYILNIKNNKWQANSIIEEKQTKRDQMNEFIILGLRMSNGVSLDKFEKKFQENMSDIYWNSIIKLIQDNLVVIDDNRYLKLTKKGLDYANIVWEAFL